MLNERQRKMMQYLSEEGFVKVETFSKMFQVSGETIRRDLKLLEANDYIKRVHGGVLYENQRSKEKTYDARTQRNFAEKRAIARLAAQYVENGDSIAMNTGTSTLELAYELAKKERLTVVTNSMEVARVIVENKTHEVYLAGGCLRKEGYGLSGELCCEFLSMFHVDKVFLSVGGIAEKSGVTEYHVQESAVMREMIKMSNKIMVLADYSKFNEIAFQKICEYNKIDYLFTDWRTPMKEITACKNHGIRVITAKKPEMWE